ncbi:EPIDERMAL PATTERNING FACTOR-like protein 4, partial [Cucurbita argyrosperma subsp. sororia]
MAVVLHHHRRRRPPRPTLLLLAALLLLASAIAARPTPIGKSLNSIPLINPFLGFTKTEETEFPAMTRRRLRGLGSSPPICRSKCGSCSPCTAVHIPIQPGLSLPSEYYPEAWRCKCGNSLYLP